MESGQTPSPNPTTPQPSDPLAAAEKKFKIAAAIAVVLGIAAIGFAIWAFSESSTEKDDSEEIAGDETRLNSAKANYEKIRSSLSSADKDDQALEAEVASLKKQLDAAEEAESQAKSTDEKQAAQISRLEAQLALAQTCAQGAIRSFSTLTDEANDDAGLSAIEGTISKLSKVNSECEEVVN